MFAMKDEFSFEPVPINTHTHIYIYIQFDYLIIIDVIIIQFDYLIKQNQNILYHSVLKPKANWKKKPKNQMA